MLTFGQFIKQKRSQAKLTQIQVANYLGYYDAEIMDLLENRERFWTVHHVELLASLFDVQPWELMKEWIENSS